MIFFPEHYSVAQAMELVNLISRDNSEVEDFSDIDDPVADADYKLPQKQQEQSSSEEDSRGCEDPIPQPSQPFRGCKCLRDEYQGFCSDRDIARSRTPRRHSQAHSRMRLMSQAMSLKRRQQQHQAKKNSPKKGVGCDGGRLC